MIAVEAVADARKDGAVTALDADGTTVAVCAVATAGHGVQFAIAGAPAVYAVTASDAGQITAAACAAVIACSAIAC
jgi:hypothetical protein